LINPKDIPDVDRLRGWYDEEGHGVKVISGDGGLGGMGFGGPESWKTLSFLEGAGVGTQGRGDYLTCKATVRSVKKENCLYRACKGDGCFRKVVDLGNGQFRCEKCGVESDKYHWRLLLHLTLADITSSQLVTCFNAEAERLLERRAEEIAGLQEEQVRFG
jgi:replication factor A1